VLLGAGISLVPPLRSRAAQLVLAAIAASAPLAAWILALR